MRDTRRNRLVLLGLLTLAFALITVDARAGSDSPLSGARGLASAVFGPVEHGTTDVVNPVADWVGSIRRAGRNRQEVASLQQANAKLRSELQAQGMTATREGELTALMHLAGEGQYTIVPAMVIGIGAGQGFTWTVTLDVGSDDGVAANETVVNGDGLVGRVVTVGPSESTVLLAIDPGFSVGTRMEKSLEAGLVQGQGNSPLRLELLNGQAAIAPGDRLVTLGSQDDKPFVPGVPVGTVTSVVPTPGQLTRTALVTPFVNYTALDVVGVVVKPPPTDPRNAVLPPLPPPPVAPTPTAKPTSPASPARGAGEPGPSASASSSASPTRSRRH